MVRFPRPEMIRVSWMPARTASSTTYWMAGLSRIGSISFGCAFVAGRNLVPRPAAGMTAFLTFTRPLLPLEGPEVYPRAIPTSPSLARGIGTRVTRMEPATEKMELRERMRSARATIPSAERAVLAARAEARLLALPDLRAATTVLMFYSFGTEIPTAVLVRRLLTRGWRVLLPYLTDGSEMDAGEIRPGDPLEPTDYGPK